MKNTSTADHIISRKPAVFERAHPINSPVAPPAPPENTVAFQILQLQQALDSHEKCLIRLGEILGPVIIMSPVCERERDVAGNSELPALANTIRIQADQLNRLTERLNVLTNSIRL